MATTATSDSTKSNSSTASYNTWAEGAKAKLLDLNTSDDDLIKFIGKEFSAAGSSEEKRQALQQLISLRSQMAAGMSNILKILSETARSIINNIRP